MTRAIAAFALAAALAGCAAAPPLPPPQEPAAAAAAPTHEPLTPEEEVLLNALVAPARPPGDQRREVASKPFRIAALPEASIPDPLALPAPRAMPEGPDAQDLVMEKASQAPASGYQSVKIAIRGRGYARLRIGYSETSLVLGEGGLHTTCGGAPGRSNAIVPARWEVMESVADPSGSRIVYRVVNAWFDTVRCKGTVVGRGSVTPKPVVDGALYAFRKACAACSGRESVVFLAPRIDNLSINAFGGDASSQGGSFTRVVLPVRPGGSAALMGRVLEAPLREWGKLFEPSDVQPTDVVVGVDIAQGVTDPDPVAVAYMGAPSWARRPAPAPVGSNR